MNHAVYLGVLSCISVVQVVYVVLIQLEQRDSPASGTVRARTMRPRGGLYAASFNSRPLRFSLFSSSSISRVDNPWDSYPTSTPDPSHRKTLAGSILTISGEAVRTISVLKGRQRVLLSRYLSWPVQEVSLRTAVLVQHITSTLSLHDVTFSPTERWATLPDLLDLISHHDPDIPPVRASCPTRLLSDAPLHPSLRVIRPLPRTASSSLKCFSHNHFLDDFSSPATHTAVVSPTTLPDLLGLPTYMVAS